MLSYCIFDKDYWHRGIGTFAVRLFIEEFTKNFEIRQIGAFTYDSNSASIALLNSLDFKLVENFSEDGIGSSYFELQRLELY